MISVVRLLRAVGQFVNVDEGSTLPLEKLTLIYSENGRGKTTLAAVLGSLAAGDPTPILERRRISGTTEPHVVVTFANGQTAVFQDGTWNAVHNEVVVFDEEFVDRDVYSGLGVDPEHRQHLHELIIGTQAVSLNERLGSLVARVEAHNRELRSRAEAVTATLRQGLTVEDFCALPAVPDVDSKVAQTERDLAIARDALAIGEGPLLVPLELTQFDTDRIDALLSETLGLGETAIPVEVREHLLGLGQGGEHWVEEGLTRLRANVEHGNHCPFCAQDLAGSALVDPYATLFSDAYRTLALRVADWIDAIDRRHGGDVIAAFERSVTKLVDAAAFWRPFVESPALTVDTAELAALRIKARDALREALVRKRQDPLSRIHLSENANEAIDAYNHALSEIDAINESVREINIQIAIAKERVHSANVAELAASLSRLRAIKARYEHGAATACDAFLSERLAKEGTEREREETRRELDAHRAAVFPGYQESTNFYLQRLNAGFRLDDVTPVNTRGGPSITYNVVIDEVPVAVHRAGGGGGPSFRTTLSAGDRTTLALAFFLALLERMQPLDTKVVVVDDPVSSLDDQRSWATVQELRRLGERVTQVIVLSHNKPFLCNLWQASERVSRASVQIIRVAIGSGLAPWDVSLDSLGEHDRRDRRFRTYLERATGDRAELARDLRPHLEAYLRHSHPSEFPPNSLIGPFLQVCRDRVGSPRQVLDEQRIVELEELLDFGNRFHHDSNPQASNEQVTDGELERVISRVRAFAGV